MYAVRSRCEPLGTLNAEIVCRRQRGLRSYFGRSPCGWRESPRGPRGPRAQQSQRPTRKDCLLRKEGPGGAAGMPTGARNSNLPLSSFEMTAGADQEHSVAP